MQLRGVIYNNPCNPDVRGVPLHRIRQLFPEGKIHHWKLTLAPPSATGPFTVICRPPFVL